MPRVKASSSSGPRALAAVVRQATAGHSSASAVTESATAVSVRALALRRASSADAQPSLFGSSSAVPSSSLSPAAAAADGADGGADGGACCRRCGRAGCACCRRCGRAGCACAGAPGARGCGRCGRAACRCGPSYGAALPSSFGRATPFSGRPGMQARGVSSSAAAAAEASKQQQQEQPKPEEPKQEQGQETQQQQKPQQEQEQAGNSSSSSGGTQDQQPPQHLFSRLQEGAAKFLGGAATQGGGGGAADGSGAAAESPADRARRLLRSAAREVADAVLPREERVSLTIAYEGPVWEPPAAGSPEAAAAAAAGGGAGSTALAVAAPPPPSAAKKLLDDLRARFGAHPLFARLSAAAAQAPGSAAAAEAAGAAGAAAQAAARRAKEAADALRERYETSDHPAVHRAEEVKERLFGATEAAEALAEALRRDPRFDVARLLASVKHDARPVVGAFLAHDLPTLRRYAGPELLERLTGVFAHFEAQGGLREDPTILFVGDPELIEVKMVEGDPMVVVQFACQQIKATRDKFGNVVDGSPNSIQRVFYFWGLVQDKAGVVLPDGRPLPPRWALRDMMWQSVLALV